MDNPFKFVKVNQGILMQGFLTEEQSRTENTTLKEFQDGMRAIMEDAGIEIIGEEYEQTLHGERVVMLINTSADNLNEVLGVAAV